MPPGERMTGHALAVGEIQRNAKAAHMRLRQIKKQPAERRLEELREARLELLAAVSDIERLLALAASIGQTVGARV